MVLAACALGAVAVVTQQAPSATASPANANTAAANTAAASPAAYQPGQILQAYGISALHAEGITGSGTTIAIVDPDGSPTIASDLSTFDAESGLPAPPSLTVIQPMGQVPAYSPANPDLVAWAIETTLDVEYAHAVAPGARIILVLTPDAGGLELINDAEEYVIEHYHPDVISQSFTATEQTLPSRDDVDAMHNVYAEAQSLGITVVASSGDTGAAGTGTDGVTYYPYPVTSYPASDPLVTSVGGTTLHLDAAGDRVSPDTVWNDTYSTATSEFDYGNAGSDPLASGGGTSTLFARPSYQDGVRNVTGDARGVPDVSMSAACSAPVDIYSSAYSGGAGQASGWYPACGSSEAAPLFAGVVALADQVAGHPLGLINPALYRLAAEHAPGIVAVTSGNNTVSFDQDGREQTVTGYSARDGYSLAAGVGTINAAKFVPELAATASPGRSAPTPAPTPALAPTLASAAPRQPAAPRTILCCLPPRHISTTSTQGSPRRTA
jgi:subtilase family serine protease